MITDEDALIIEEAVEFFDLPTLVIMHDKYNISNINYCCSSTKSPALLVDIFKKILDERKES